MNSSPETHGLAPRLAIQAHEAIARLSRRFRSLHLPGNLTQERFSTLAAVRAHEPVSLSSLADMEKIRLSTMSRMVSFLEDEDLVRRRDNKSDGRSVLISTTAKGRRLYERAVNQSLEQIVAAIGSLEREQLTAVRQLLSQLGS